MKILIREYQGEPIADITALLHRAYKPLADAGMMFLASYQDDARTMRRIESGKCFVALDNDKIIGTIVYYTAYKNRPDAPDIYNTDGISHFGQFAVEPAMQQQGIGSKLVEHVEEFAKRNGDHTISFDTSEKALTLIKYYEKRGYEFAAYHQWADTNYRSVVMKKSLV